MPRQPPPPLPQQPGALEPEIWRACAGPSVEIPKPNSMVYYFPQGHFDQAFSAPRNLSARLLAKPFVTCNVESVQFLADPLTDEVFAKMFLRPVVNNFVAEPFRTSAAAPPPRKDDNEVVSFAKILTPSDANNGGGFSVPRFCADSIFPPLNFKDDPPVQNLSVTDVHGFTWEFRHIFRGTPRRHLLTTGWSTFVNNKKLVAGDSVLFMKNAAERLFVGIRRVTRLAPGKGGGCAKLRLIQEDEEKQEEEDDEKPREVFSRDGKGKLSVKVVTKAAEAAVRNLPFEVVYYPKAGWSEFVVKTETVDAAMRIPWSEGMRVKMSIETDDSSRMTWFQGTVSAVSSHDSGGQWCGSPWRMLQVTWDEPEGMQNAKWVSPWQVELVSTTPALHSAFPSTKRFRTAHGYEMFNDGEGGPFPMTGFPNSAVEHLNQAFWAYDTFPAGMQGARHDAFSASSFSNYPGDISRMCQANSRENSTFKKLKNLSTEYVGRSPSDELSTDSRSSFHSCVTDPVRNHNRNAIKLASDSIQLFGAVIWKEQPAQNGLTGTGCASTRDKSLGR